MSWTKALVLVGAGIFACTILLALDVATVDIFLAAALAGMAAIIATVWRPREPPTPLPEGWALVLAGIALLACLLPLVDLGSPRAGWELVPLAGSVGAAVLVRSRGLRLGLVVLAAFLYRIDLAVQFAPMSGADAWAHGLTVSQVIEGGRVSAAAFEPTRHYLSMPLYHVSGAAAIPMTGLSMTGWTVLWSGLALTSAGLMVARLAKPGVDAMVLAVFLFGDLLVVRSLTNANPEALSLGFAVLAALLANRGSRLAYVLACVFWAAAILTHGLTGLLGIPLLLGMWWATGRRPDPGYLAQFLLFLVVLTGLWLFYSAAASYDSGNLFARFVVALDRLFRTLGTPVDFSSTVVSAAGGSFLLNLLLRPGFAVLVGIVAFAWATGKGRAVRAATAALVAVYLVHALLVVPGVSRLLPHRYLVYAFPLLALAVASFQVRRLAIPAVLAAGVTFLCVTTPYVMPDERVYADELWVRTYTHDEEFAGVGWLAEHADRRTFSDAFVATGPDRAFEERIAVLRGASAFPPGSPLFLRDDLDGAALRVGGRLSTLGDDEGGEGIAVIRCASVAAAVVWSNGADVVVSQGRRDIRPCLY